MGEYMPFQLCFRCIAEARMRRLLGVLYVCASTDALLLCGARTSSRSWDRQGYDYITHENLLLLTALESSRVSSSIDSLLQSIDRSWLVCLYAIENFCFPCYEPLHKLLHIIFSRVNPTSFSIWKYLLLPLLRWSKGAEVVGVPVRVCDHGCTTALRCWTWWCRTYWTRWTSSWSWDRQEIDYITNEFILEKAFSVFEGMYSMDVYPPVACI